MRLEKALALALGLCLLGGCAAPQAPNSAPEPTAQQSVEAEIAEASQPTATPLPEPVTLGPDDPQLDFTIELPGDLQIETWYKYARFTRGGIDAGGINEAHFPEGSTYSIFMREHWGYEIVEEWHEIEADFADDGPWRENLEKTVMARFKYDNNGAHSEQTLYYLIFDDQQCYILCFVTQHTDEGGNRREVFTQDEIDAAMRSFALEGERPYNPEGGIDGLAKLALDTLKEALFAGETPEARQMYEALGSPAPKRWRYDFIGEQAWRVVALGSGRACECTYGRGGIKATVLVDMDTAEVVSLVFEEDPEQSDIDPSTGEPWPSMGIGQPAPQQ